MYKKLSLQTWLTINVTQTDMPAEHTTKCQNFGHVQASFLHGMESSCIPFGARNLYKKFVYNKVIEIRMIRHCKRIK